MTDHGEGSYDEGISQDVTEAMIRISPRASRRIRVCNLSRRGRAVNIRGSQGLQTLHVVVVYMTEEACEDRWFRSNDLSKIVNYSAKSVMGPASGNVRGTSDVRELCCFISLGVMYNTTI